jgi:hypothetical protein
MGLPVIAMLLIACVLIGVGIFVGLLLAAGVGVAITLGVVSSSAVIALIKGKLTSGLRAVHYQSIILGMVALSLGLMAAYGLVSGQMPRGFVGAAIVGLLLGWLSAFCIDRLGLLIWNRIQGITEYATGYLANFAKR